MAVERALGYADYIPGRGRYCITQVVPRHFEYLGVTQARSYTNNPQRN
jgi:hypothetical protein